MPLSALVTSISFVLGVLAVLGAVRVKGPLAERLGRSWRVRFCLMQGGVINAFVLYVVSAVAKANGWTSGGANWAVPAGYAVLFFFYSLSNIDWTARKFHPEVERP